ncbi:MAG: ABC transporter ATP-binding protein [Deltaproteobacteria bacterium RBG_16_47_11]|nr:MAG: ABC transporter ATP-binding protein [Deltaproteobacteria bacterium RBG_16_47_11]
MLSLRAVDAFYGKVNVLKKVSFDIPKGSVITLLGANGAGKTTSLNTICGFVYCKSGEILFDGRNIRGLPPHQIVRLGISQVSQERNLFNKMTVLENLELGAVLRKDKANIKKDMEGMFSSFPKLRDRRNNKAMSLSGGELQMLAIARALMARPKLLLMDEPSSGLASYLILEVKETIKRLNSAGLTILLVEQNTNLAFSVAEVGYILRNGETVFSDKISNIKNKKELVASYLGG